MTIANYCPEKQVLFFLLFTQGKQVTPREQRLSQDRHFIPVVSEMLVKCFKKYFQTWKRGRCFQQRSEVQVLRVLGAPGRRLVRHWALMSLEVHAGH